MVSFVRKKKEQKPLLVETVLESLNNISEKALIALKQKNLKILGELMVNYYRSLKKLDISTRKLDKIIDIAISSGALGAKPTGAWGGGCCLVLGRDQKQILSLVKIFKDKNFKCFQAKIGAEGVKKEL
jgi:mevalonate kinase